MLSLPHQFDVRMSCLCLMCLEPAHHVNPLYTLSMTELAYLLLALQAVFQLKGQPQADVEMRDAPAATAQPQHPPQQAQQQGSQRLQQGCKRLPGPTSDPPKAAAKGALPQALISNGQGWLAGAAGRLASHIYTLPGVCLLPSAYGCSAAESGAVLQHALSPKASMTGLAMPFPTSHFL